MPWITPYGDYKRTTGVLPEIGRGFDRLYSCFWTQAHLPPTTLELCRLRLAQLHGCALEWNREEVALPRAMRDQLSRWATVQDYSPAQRSCLALTEVYAIDTAAITDQQATEVKQHYGDAGLVTLVEALGVFDGKARLSLLWQLSTPSDTSAGGH